MTIKTRLGKLEDAHTLKKAIRDKYAGGSPVEIYKRMIHDSTYCPSIITAHVRPDGKLSPEEAYQYMATGNLP
jgi:hypothetical protein